MKKVSFLIFYFLVHQNIEDFGSIFIFIFMHLYRIKCSYGRNTSDTTKK